MMIYQFIGSTALSTITGKNREELLRLQANGAIAKNAVFYNDETFDNMYKQSSLDKLLADNFHLRSCLYIPVCLTGKGDRKGGRKRCHQNRCAGDCRNE